MQQPTRITRRGWGRPRAGAHSGPRGKTAGPAGARHLDVLVEEGLDSPLVTELDGRLGHDLVGEVWRDMDRDDLDEEAGRGHLRYGPAQLFGDGCRVAVQVAVALGNRGWRGTPVACGPACALATHPVR